LRHSQTPGPHSTAPGRAFFGAVSESSQSGHRDSGCHSGHRRSDTSRSSCPWNGKNVARVSLLRSGFQRLKRRRFVGRYVPFSKAQQDLRLRLRACRICTTRFQITVTPSSVRYCVTTCAVAFWQKETGSIAYCKPALHDYKHSQADRLAIRASAREHPCGDVLPPSLARRRRDTARVEGAPRRTRGRSVSSSAVKRKTHMSSSLGV